MNKLTTNTTKNQCATISMYITKRNYIIVGNTWKFWSWSQRVQKI